MQKKLNQGIWIIAIILFIGVLSIILYQSNIKQKVVTKNLFYMDTQIYIKLYGSNLKKMNDAVAQVEKLYEQYHQLTDRYQEYNDIVNPYYIYHNTEQKDVLTVDPRLYNILELAQNWHLKNNLFDITIGNVIDVWKKYRESGTGIPSEEELLEANKQKKELVFLENNTIENNHVSIDLGSVAKGYATEEAGKLLKSLGISTYLINAGGNVIVGDSYNKKDYTIGIEDPTNDKKDIFTIVHGQNMSIVTSGGYERFYEYNGQKYNHIINPISLFPGTYSKSVTVITKNSAEADILSTILFLLPIDQGMEFVERFDNTEAIWYTNDNLIVRSSGMKNYENK